MWRALVLSLVAAAPVHCTCAGNDPGPGGAPPADAGTTLSDGATPDAALSGGLQPGSLQVSWMHGSAACNQNSDPELQVHKYNETTYILRQNKCRTFEAPFVYLLLGAERALLHDTGATNTSTLQGKVQALASGRSLLVTHTHAHGDHVASDGQFAGQPQTTVVGTSRAAVQSAFGIASWPTDLGQVDLGGRVLDVIALPGHEDSHVALYDRQTGLLLTGDSLYPGLLFIRNWAQYRASIARLAQFVAAHPVSHVLGAHIEMTRTETVHYPYGTTYQPAEHVLQLAPAHVAELDLALVQLGATPPSASQVSQCMNAPRPLDAACRQIVHADFVISPQ